MEIQSIQGISSVKATLEPYKTQTKSRISTRDTISSVPYTYIYTHTSPIQKFIENLNRLDTCGNIRQVLSAQELEAYITTMETLQERRASHLEKGALNQGQGETWNFIHNLGTCISSATFIVMGASMISSGTGIPVGIGLIASGVLSIGTVVGTTSGALDLLAYHLAPENPEKQSLYKMLIPGCLQLASACLGITGIASASTLAACGQRLQQIAGAAAGIASGIAIAGRGITQSQLDNLNAETTNTEQLTLICQNQVEQEIRNLKFFLESSGQNTQIAAELMQTLALATKEIMV